MNTDQIRIHLMLILALGFYFALAGQLCAGSDSNKHPKAPAPPQPKTGEQIFRTNCSRCHVAPMSLSTRITGTIIMHMRVRARLSREDEALLLKYLAP
jgi:hypothetical protein